MAKKEAKNKEEPKFMRSEIVKSARYRDSIDLVNALLEDGQAYTLTQVDKAIEEYLNEEVK